MPSASAAASAAASATRKKILFFAALCAFTLLVAGSVLILSSRKPQPLSLAAMEESVAKSQGIPVETYRKHVGMFDKVKAAGGAISKSDWNDLAAAATGSQHFLRTNALAGMSVIDPKSEHGPAAVGYAKAYLSENHSGGNVVAIMVLRRFGDPAWKDYARRLADDPQAVSASLAQSLLDKGER